MGYGVGVWTLPADRLVTLLGLVDGFSFGLGTSLGVVVFCLWMVGFLFVVALVE